MRYVKSTRKRRENRVRKSVCGHGRPRLSVFRSGKYVYAQLIDDENHCTLAAASSQEKEASSLGSTSNLLAAKWVGQKVAERGIAKGIKEVVFDRGAYRYHGGVKALAEAARDCGLSF